jgi:hypothetical protein
MTLISIILVIFANYSVSTNINNGRSQICEKQDNKLTETRDDKLIASDVDSDLEEIVDTTICRFILPSKLFIKAIRRSLELKELNRPSTLGHFNHHVSSTLFDLTVPLDDSIFEFIKSLEGDKDNHIDIKGNTNDNYFKFIVKTELVQPVLQQFDQVKEELYSEGSRPQIFKTSYSQLIIPYNSSLLSVLKYIELLRINLQRR